MTRALVLGGGGPVGIAWESGLIAGLAEAGVDLSAVDFIVGTSAGSFTGALLASGRTPAAMVAPYLNGSELPATASQLLKSAPDLTPLIGKIMDAYAGVRPGSDVRAEIGAWALENAVMSEEIFVGTYDRSLAGFADDYWPAKRFACTSVDAATGEFQVWEAGSGASLKRAVASSSAVPGLYPPVSIGGHRYIDGGMRSGTNADLAKGFDLVLIVALSHPASPEVFRRPLERELEVLAESGSKVVMITPDEESWVAFGPNLMDHRKRADAAENGYRQGRAGSPLLINYW